MRYFLDTEFHEDGRTIDLISIGIKSEDGREYYAVNAECDFDRIWTDDSCAWLRENVMCYLPANPRQAGLPRAQVAADIVEFVKSPDGQRPQFWGYYADYDWVALCQLYGRMIDLPKSFPKFCLDIKQTCLQLGNPQLPPQIEDEHHALAAARWNKRCYDFLTGT